MKNNIKFVLKKPVKKLKFTIKTIKNKSVKVTHRNTNQDAFLKKFTRFKTLNNKEKKIIKTEEKNTNFKSPKFPLLFKFKGQLVSRTSICDERLDSIKEYNDDKQKEFINNFIENFLLNYNYILNCFKSNTEKRDQFLMNWIFSYSYNKEQIFSFFYTKKYILKVVNKKSLLKFIIGKNNDPITSLVDDLKKIESKIRDEIWKSKSINFSKSFNHLKETWKNLKVSKKPIIKGLNWINKSYIENPYLLFDNNNIRKKWII